MRQFRVPPAPRARACARIRALLLLRGAADVFSKVLGVSYKRKAFMAAARETLPTLLPALAARVGTLDGLAVLVGLGLLEPRAVEHAAPVT